MSEWHTWDEVRDELADVLGSPDEQVRRRDQLCRELAVARLVELRKRTGLRQVDVAERMGVSKARVSHIEHGEVATVDLLARYLDALGGRLEITAAFDGGAERIVLDWPVFLVDGRHLRGVRHAAVARSARVRPVGGSVVHRVVVVGTSGRVRPPTHL